MPAQDAGVSGIGNAARVPSIPPPTITPAVPPTVSAPTTFRTVPVQRAVKLRRTRFAAVKSRHGTKETVREREDKATVRERDKLLDRKILSICRGC